jgi:hypothetical protein
MCTSSSKNVMQTGQAASKMRTQHVWGATAGGTCDATRRDQARPTLTCMRFWRSLSTVWLAISAGILSNASMCNFKALNNCCSSFRVKSEAALIPVRRRQGEHTKDKRSAAAANGDTKYSIQNSHIIKSLSSGVSESCPLSSASCLLRSR